MINKIRISNFKCIDNADIELKPLTILCGPNSSGKSSFSQALLLLKQSSEAIGGIHTLSPRGKIVDLGSYPDLIRNHDTKSLLSYHLQIDTTSRYLRNALITLSFLMRREFKRRVITPRQITSFQCDIDYKYLSDQEKIDLDRISITSGSQFLIESRKNRTGTYRFAYGYPTTNQKFKWSNPNLKSLTDFLSPQPARQLLMGERLSTFKSEKLFQIRRILLGYISALSLETEVLNYLGPFRQVPSRYYMTGGAMPSDIGYKGESSVDYISYMKMSEDEEIIDFTKYWLKRLNYAKDFDVTTIKSFIKSVQLQNSITKIESSLIDVGFGISQVLPVIIAVFRHKAGIHIFEQPEIHLHPRSQADIADLFIENKKSNISFIVETHSEHFLNRIRRRVAEGTLKPNEVKIYYVFHDMNGYHADEVEIGENGSFVAFPENFFDEAYRESKMIVKAAIDRG